MSQLLADLREVTSSSDRILKGKVREKSNANLFISTREGEIIVPVVEGIEANDSVTLFRGSAIKDSDAVENIYWV